MRDGTEWGSAKVDTDTGTPDAVFAGAGGAGFGVYALLIHGNSLYAGGGGPNHVAKMDLLSGQTDAAFAVNGSPDGTVNALVDTPTAIYVGGQFQNYGTLPARNLAKVDPVTGALDQAFTRATGAGGGTEFIYSLLTASTSLYAGGYVNSYRGSTVQSLLKLDAVTGALDTTFTQATGFPSGVWSLASSGSSILVAGSFRTYRGIQTFNLAKVNASSGNLDSTFTSNLPCDSCDISFYTMSLVGSHLYVGGEYSTLYRGAPAFGWRFPCGRGDRRAA